MEPPSYKAAFLSKTVLPPQPKFSLRVFPSRPKDLQRRCFRCLSYSHLIASCRDSVICWFCRTSGHYRRNCPLVSQFKLQTKSQKMPTPASTMELAILGCPTSLDVHCPPATDLISLCRGNNQPPASPQNLSSSSPVGRAISSTSVAGSSSAKTPSESTAAIFLMGNRVRCTLQQNTNPNLYDFLAFLAQTSRLCLEGFPGHTPLLRFSLRGELITFVLS